MTRTEDPIPKILIRPATVADAERIHSSVLGIARVMDGVDKVRCTVADLIDYGFGPDPHFEAVIAEVDGAYAGMCLFFRSFSTWQGRPGAYVQDLFVDDAFRGLGVGAKLLRRVAAIIRDRGGSYLRLSVDVQNSAAQAFYTRIDITVSDTEQIHAAYGETFLNLAAADSPPGGTLKRTGKQT
ncbi:GNAT family N-acetyltransferase [Kumtagia ephedrae]|uniref:GNAT family N-acetyltransferase n=1 Tax=Kumtagia ephedrae TaxID=2116701 RepID=A0A2P7S3K7_9HYPH|nr:GNAT family N-acetyltransferase [Mesorhizobium ephedrae]PSJ57033.1 GNAT family N-acetyltransferase [Mesorhizobium ephedrae]